MREIADRFEYLLHLPSGDGPWPLLLYLHGLGEARDQRPDSVAPVPLSAIKKHGAPPAQCDPSNPGACNELVERFIVLSPQLRRRGPWDPDLRLVGSLVREVITRHPVNSNRLFVAGFSVGGSAAIQLVQRERLRFTKWIAVEADGDPPGWPRGAAGQIPHLLVNGTRGIASRSALTRVVQCNGLGHTETARAAFGGRLLVSGKTIYEWLLA